MAMKVICPECSAEYDVPIPLMGDAGRRVRCSTCGHIWMADLQAAEDTSFGSFGRFNDNLDVEPIPTSLHPDMDENGDGVDGPGFFASLNKGYLARLAGGFGLACLLFAIFLGIGVAAGLNEGAMRPIFAPFGLAGAPQKSPLEIGQVIAKAQADAAGQPVLQITGRIHNNADHTVRIPLVEITLLSETGVAGDSLQVEVPEKEIEGGKDVVFVASMPGGASHGDKVRIRFIP